MIGMLWADFSNQPLQDKILKAASYYQTKYGQRPNVVHVSKHEKLDGVDVDGISIFAHPQVLPHHFWLGVSHDRDTH